MRYMIFIVASFLLVSFQNCSDAEFSAIPHSKTAGASVVQGDDGTAKETFVIEVYRDQKALDIVWLIDSSGSMNNEINHVKNNLNSFLTQLNETSSTQMLLIAQQNRVSLTTEQKAQGHVQINRTVASRDALQITSRFLQGTGESSSHIGVFNNFFRVDSEKVFVYVTDDNDTGVSASTIANRGQQYFGATPTAYGFIGMPNGGCSITRTGDTYESLVNLTGGKSFNICETDWTEHFNNLKASVSSLLASTFALSGAPQLEDIISVKVNGEALEAGEFSLEGNKLKIVGAELVENGQVVVHYRN